MTYVFRLDELSFLIGGNLPTSNLWENFSRRDYSLVREACQLILRIPLVKHKLSGLVAHDLSGSHRTPRRGTYETDRVATGDSTNEIRGSL